MLIVLNIIYPKRNSVVLDMVGWEHDLQPFFHRSCAELVFRTHAVELLYVSWWINISYKSVWFYHFVYITYNHFFLLTALQADYKKACDMADENSREVRDLIDQLSKKEEVIIKLRQRIDTESESMKEISATLQ